MNKILIFFSISNIKTKHRYTINFCAPFLLRVKTHRSGCFFHLLQSLTKKTKRHIITTITPSKSHKSKTTTKAQLPFKEAHLNQRTSTHPTTIPSTPKKPNHIQIWTDPKKHFEPNRTHAVTFTTSCPIPRKLRTMILRLRWKFSTDLARDYPEAT